MHIFLLFSMLFNGIHYRLFLGRFKEQNYEAHSIPLLDPGYYFTIVNF